MNEYEDLNLPQLLELMHGLALPESISRMPEGPGWWILIGWLFFVTVFIARALVASYRRNQYRRDALAVLERIEASAGANPGAAAADIAVLLKQTALAAYPRDEVAALYGEGWARFLNDSASNDPEVEASAMALATASYRPDADGRSLVSPARRWIRVHRA